MKSARSRLGPLPILIGPALGIVFVAGLRAAAGGKTVECVAVAPRGSALKAAGAEGQVRLGENPSGQAIRTRVPAGRGKRYHAAAVGCAGRTLAVGGEQSVVYFWDWTSGQHLGCCLLKASRRTPSLS